MSELPSMTELATELRHHVEKAEAAIPGVRFAQGYPVYPAAFLELTRFITRSPWHRTDYLSYLARDWEERLDELTEREVGACLTFLCRVDRQSPGGLLSFLEKGIVARLAERACELASKRK